VGLVGRAGQAGAVGAWALLRVDVTSGGRLLAARWPTNLGPVVLTPAVGIETVVDPRVVAAGTTKGVPGSCNVSCEANVAPCEMMKFWTAAPMFSLYFHGSLP